MKVQQVKPNLSFEAKQRFLNVAQRENVQTLVEKMSKTLQFKSDGMFFEITTTNRLKINDKAEFVGANLAKNKDRCFDKIHFTVEKTQLLIDTVSGEIEEYNKPLFTRWTKVMEKVDKYLVIFMENFNNSNIVKQEKFKVSGMTPEAFEIFQREMNKLFKESKKNDKNNTRIKFAKA